MFKKKGNGEKWTLEWVFKKFRIKDLVNTSLDLIQSCQY